MEMNPARGLGIGKPEGRQTVLGRIQSQRKMKGSTERNVRKVAQAVSEWNSKEMEKCVFLDDTRRCPVPVLTLIRGFTVTIKQYKQISSPPKFRNLCHFPNMTKHK